MFSFRIIGQIIVWNNTHPQAFAPTGRATTTSLCNRICLYDSGEA